MSNIKFSKEFFTLALLAIPACLMRWYLNNDLLINIFGSLLVGFLAGININSRQRFLFNLGFCGALTTFSGWIIRVIHLLLNGYLFQSFGLILLMLFCGMLSVSIGFLIGKKLTF